MQALIGGDLDLRSGCSSVRRAAGPVTLVWAGDVREQDGGLVFEGRRFAHGAAVSFGGGFVPPSAYRGLTRKISELGCSGPFFLVQTVEP